MARRAKLKLMTRVLTFVFAFPVVTMLIIDGPFGIAPDPAFEVVNPAHWYVARYLIVVTATTGLVMLPVHLASCRERGVLRQFAAAGFPRWLFAAAELIARLLTIAVACGLLLAVAAPVHGIPAAHDWWPVAAVLPLGAVAFVNLGVLLGLLLPPAADGADQCGPRAVAGSRPDNRVAGRSGGSGGRGHRRRCPQDAL
jgi:ABC-2 type transport system permease protein